MVRFPLIVFFFLFAAVAQGAVPVGTIALYSDGRVEKLIAEDERGLLWEDDRKRQWLRSRNPAVPVLEGRQIMVGTSYTHILDSGNPDALMRLPAGTPVNFTMIRNRNGGVKTRYWRCILLGEVREQVLGQARVLDQYRCERRARSRKLNTFVVRDEREFTYSRDLGVMVDMERTSKKGQRTRRLVALFKPGEIDHKGLTKAVRKLRAD